MNIEEFLARVNPSRLKQTGDGVYFLSCPCASHGKGQGDRSPSLSAAAGRDGGVVLFCHAGCRTEDVAAAFGLTMADLMNDTSRPQTRVAPKLPRKIAAVYKYTDEAGQLLFEVIRYQPKDFRQRRPDGEGDWSWKLGDTRRVLYHLPELIAGVAAGKPVYVCEGEKDVEALRKAGVIATCNPHGAGKWKPEYGEFLRGADVTIVQDRDEPGRQHVAAVAASLAPLAASVRIVEAAVGKDASDHLTAGRTLDEFIHVDGSVAAVPAGEQASALSRGPSAPSPRLKLVQMSEVVPSTVDWLWHGRLPRGKLAVLAGDPGLGKSYLTLKMAALVSTGGEWPDGSLVAASNVLAISAEDDAADTIRPRLDRLRADVPRISLIDGVLMDGAEYARPFSLKLHVDLLREAIVETDAAIVIVDPLNAFLGGIDSHKAAEVRGLLSPLAHVAALTHAAILAVHHLNKGSSTNALYRASGSLDFVAAARIVHGVAADPEAEGRRLFVPLKCNLAALPEGLGFHIDESGVTFDNQPVTLDAAAAFSTRSLDHEERSEREMAKEFLRDELADGPVAASKLFATAKGYGFSTMTVRRAANDLHICKRKDGYQGPWLWSLPEERGGAEAGKGSRPEDASTFDTFGASRLDREEGTSTFDGAGTPSDDQHPPDPDDDRGPKDGHGQRLTVIADRKDDHQHDLPSLKDAEDDHLHGRTTFGEADYVPRPRDDPDRRDDHLDDNDLGRGSTAPVAAAADDTTWEEL